jgi:hypothetical protein
MGELSKLCWLSLSCGPIVPAPNSPLTTHVSLLVRYNSQGIIPRDLSLKTRISCRCSFQIVDRASEAILRDGVHFRWRNKVSQQTCSHTLCPNNRTALSVPTNMFSHTLSQQQNSLVCPNKHILTHSVSTNILTHSVPTNIFSHSVPTNIFSHTLSQQTYSHTLCPNKHILTFWTHCMCCVVSFLFRSLHSLSAWNSGGRWGPG